MNSADPLRVGLDVTPLLGSPSGIHQVTRGLLAALIAREDVDVTGWTLSARGPRPDIGVPVRRTRFPAGLARRLWSVTDKPGATMIAGDVDVVHGTNFSAPPGPNVVISVQDLGPINHRQWVRRGVGALRRPLERAIAAGAMIHVSSEAMADEAARVLEIDAHQLAVVHHAVTPIGPGDEARAVELAGPDRYVLALGTVEKRKNIPSLVGLLATLPDDVHLVIAGPSGNDEPTVTAAIRRNDMAGRVQRVTTLDDHDRAALLRSATALVFPSHYEGFGLPPLEALQVGTPIVATAVGVLPELISDRVELITPGDTVAFGEQLRAVVEHGHVDGDLADRIRAMTWERAAAEMTEIYRQVSD